MNFDVSPKFLLEEPLMAVAGGGGVGNVSYQS